jgi:hypothetical protein
MRSPLPRQHSSCARRPHSAPRALRARARTWCAARVPLPTTRASWRPSAAALPRLSRACIPPHPCCLPLGADPRPPRIRRGVALLSSGGRRQSPCSRACLTEDQGSNTVHRFCFRGRGWIPLHVAAAQWQPRYKWGFSSDRTTRNSTVPPLQTPVLTLLLPAGTSRLRF